MPVCPLVRSQFSLNFLTFSSYFRISILSASLVALREKLKKADPNYLSFSDRLGFFHNFLSFSSTFSDFINFLSFFSPNPLSFSSTLSVFLQLAQYFEPKLFLPITFLAQTFSSQVYPAACASSELLRACFTSSKYQPFPLQKGRFFFVRRSYDFFFSFSDFDLSLFFGF